MSSTWTCLDKRSRCRCCSWRCLYHRDLSCTWTRLQHRGLSCTWTCLQYRVLCFILNRGLMCTWTLLISTLTVSTQVIWRHLTASMSTRTQAASKSILPASMSTPTASIQELSWHGLLMPTAKGVKTASNSTPHHSCVTTQILPRACGPGGSSTCFFRGPRVPVDCHQQGGQKACHFATWHGGQHVHQNLPGQLGCMFQRAGLCHNWQGHPVNFCFVPPPPTQPMSYTATAHLAGAESVNVRIVSQ